MGRGPEAGAKRLPLCAVIDVGNRSYAEALRVVRQAAERFNVKAAGPRNSTMFTVDHRARARLDTFEERLMKLERAMHGLEMDWSETLDKVKRMMQRIAKRAEVVEKAEAAEPEAMGIASLPSADRRAEINAQILARRAR